MLYELLYKSLSEMEGFLFINVYKSEKKVTESTFNILLCSPFSNFQIASLLNCISILFQSKHSFIQLFQHSFFEFCRN